MAELEEYRTCLYCRTEIAEGRPNHANFCNGTCQSKFKQGMDEARYRHHFETNKLIPIRGARPALRARRERMTSDNVYHRICKLGEYKDKEGKPLCDEKFSTPKESRYFCDYSHQVKYNSIKKQERKVARREEAAILKKLL